MGGSRCTRPLPPRSACVREAPGPVRVPRHQWPSSPPAHHRAPAPRVKGNTALDPVHGDPKPCAYGDDDRSVVAHRKQMGRSGQQPSRQNSRAAAGRRQHRSHLTVTWSHFPAVDGLVKPHDPDDRTVKGPKGPSPTRSPFRHSLPTFPWEGGPRMSRYPGPPKGGVPLTPVLRLRVRVWWGGPRRGVPAKPPQHARRGSPSSPTSAARSRREGFTVRQGVLGSEPKVRGRGVHTDRREVVQRAVAAERLPSDPLRAPLPKGRHPPAGHRSPDTS